MSEITTGSCLNDGKYKMQTVVKKYKLTTHHKILAQKRDVFNKTVGSNKHVIFSNVFYNYDLTIIKLFLHVQTVETNVQLQPLKSSAQEQGCQ